MSQPGVYYLVTTTTRMGHPVPRRRLGTEKAARQESVRLSLTGAFKRVSLYRVTLDRFHIEHAAHMDTWTNASSLTTREQYARNIQRYGR